MNNHDIKDKEEGLEVAKRMAEEEEGIGRRPRGWTKFIIPTIAVSWSSFQLSIAHPNGQPDENESNNVLSASFNDPPLVLAALQNDVEMIQTLLKVLMLMQMVLNYLLKN